MIGAGIVAAIAAWIAFWVWLAWRWQPAGAPPLQPFRQLRRPATQRNEGLAATVLGGIGGVGAATGALALAIPVGAACVAAGPIGWLAALVLLPLAIGLGSLVGSFAVPLLAGAGLILWLVGGVG